MSDTLRLKDYKKPSFTTDHVELDFKISDDKTIVTSEVQYTRTDEGKGDDYIELDAQNPNIAEGDTNNTEPYIQKVILNGKELSEGQDFTFDNATQKLRIKIDKSAPDAIVKIKTILKPEKNTELSGFYKAGDVYCTQCESEGFRRITPFLDRPDVMASYTVSITSDNPQNDTLLSNGNLISSGQTKDGKFTSKWHDPHKKPAYLFALVNGDLEYIEDHYKTMSGRDVTLRIYTEKGEKERAQFALDRLKVSMEWDEKAYGREYDLDLFNVVVAKNFTFGAMENKSLNIFSPKYIFADPKTETDMDFFNVDRVVAHEYFHNWTGNRVTLENWFHLSLKEGFTVLREHEYSEDVGDPDLERIGQVNTLRARQFPEDDGPLAFPVLPKEVDSITNIYGTTTYEKGAEILRMIRVMIGDEKFREASDLYFNRNDGKAVRIQDLIQCFEDVSGLPFTGPEFMQWYDVAGRPSVKVTKSYDKAKQQLTLKFDQTTPSGQAFIMPCTFGLIDSKTGKEIEFTVAGAPNKSSEHTAIISHDVQTVTIDNVPETTIPSLFRGFSAFVSYEANLYEKDLLAIMKHDTDGFNRWDAAQTLFKEELDRAFVDQMRGDAYKISPKFVNALKSIGDATYGMQAALLTMPSLAEFENRLQAKPRNPEHVANAYAAVKKQLVRELWVDLSVADDLYHLHLNPTGKYVYGAKEAGERSYKNNALTMLASIGGLDTLLKADKQYKNATNMTDRQAALVALNHFDHSLRDQAFADFKSRFAGDVTTMQKYFTLQAQQKDPDAAIATVRDIMDHEPEFDHQIAHNWYALIGAFSSNYSAFHKSDGSGYELLADAVLKADKINSAIAAKLATKLADWKKYEAPHKDLMLKQLQRLADEPKLSQNLRSNVKKALPASSITNAKAPRPKI